jgi:hypothetical protein
MSDDERLDMDYSRVHRFLRRAFFARRVYAIVLFLLAFLPRVLYPVSRPLEWYDRSLRFISAVLRGDWGATYMKEHPGVFLMWLSGTGMAVRRAVLGESVVHPPSQEVLRTMLTPQELAAAIVPLALVIALEIVLVYVLLHRLTGSQAIAMVGAALLALDPFHIAKSKILMPDGVLSTTMFVSALFGLCYVLCGWKWRDLILAGVFAGLAMLAKMPAVLLVPWTGVVLLVGWWAGRKASGNTGFLRSVVLSSLVWGGVAASVFIALWPSMWVRPRLTLEAMYHAASSYAGEPHNHPNYFLGQVVTTDQGPLFYLTACLIKSTFVTLPFFGIAVLLLPAVWRKWREQAITVSMLVLYALVYGVQMTMGSKKGIRYALPLFPALDVLAAFGCVWWAERLERRFQVRWIITAVAVIAVAGQMLVSLPHHPYYDVRDNLLIGGHQVGRRLIAPMDEGEGLDLAARYLNSLPGASELRVGVQMDRAFQKYFDGQVVEFTDPSADYLVFAQNTVARRSGIEAWQALWDAYQFTDPEHQVSFGDIPYVWVYRTDRVPLSIEDIGNPRDAKLGGVVDYLGYDISPAHQITPGGVIELQLAWRARESLMANYSVFIHLLDGDGQLVAQQDNWPVRGTRPTVTWTPGEIVADYYSLPIPLDISPGRYVIYAGLYDAGSGERLPVMEDGESQPHDRLKVCEIVIQPLIPLGVKVFDGVWLGILLAGCILPVIKRKEVKGRINA